MNELEKDFAGSFVSLLKRYGLTVERGSDGLDEQTETFFFINGAGERRDEIFVSMEDVLGYQKKLEEK